MWTASLCLAGAKRIFSFWNAAKTLKIYTQTFSLHSINSFIRNYEKVFVVEKGLTELVWLICICTMTDHYQAIEKQRERSTCNGGAFHARVGIKIISFIKITRQILLSFKFMPEKLISSANNWNEEICIFNQTRSSQCANMVLCCGGTFTITATSSPPCYPFVI